MKRLYPATANRNGFTLVELLVAASVMSLVMGSVCGIYFASAGEWQRQQREKDALMATSVGTARLSDYISTAMDYYVLTRFTANDTLALCLPYDKAHGQYVPKWSDSRLQYQAGSWMVFYLSDSTGSFSRNGDILWLANVNTAAYPPVPVPDKSWSMYYNTNKGRIAPIKSLKFTEIGGGSKPRISVELSSSYKLRSTQKTISQTRQVCMKNMN
jgi:prepilin-type N-terminal cleavage/methylation domain-containing protein